MAGYSLSSKAAADIEGIYEYTILQFGLEQARGYLFGLHEQFQALAAQPTQGRRADEHAPGLRRVEYQSHIVFSFPRTTAFESCVYSTNAWT